MDTKSLISKEALLNKIIDVNNEIKQSLTPDAAKKLKEVGLDCQNNDEIKLAADLFTRAASIYEYIGDFLQSGEYYFKAGGLFEKSGLWDTAAKRYISAAKQYEKTDKIKNLIRCYEKAAKNSKNAAHFPEAADYYGLAGDIAKDCHKNIQAMLNYAKQSQIHAVRSKDEEFKNSYENFKSICNKLDNLYSITKGHYENITRDLENNACHELASTLHVDYMNIKTNHLRNIGDKGYYLYKFWGWISEYGESWRIFAKRIFCSICVFTIIYFLFGWISFENRPACLSFFMPDCLKFSRTSINKIAEKEQALLEDESKADIVGGKRSIFEYFITAFCFTITVATTLGFGNIWPSGCCSQLLVAIQVLWSYVLLSVLITILCKKVLRK